MATHIIAMNVVAPLAVWILPPARRWAARFSFGIATATIVQLAVLWGWHMPQAMRAAASHPAFGMAMHVSLFLSALLFWATVFEQHVQTPWRPIAALLVTGKLFCLLGVLLVFAPRTLYMPMAGDAAANGGQALADQHLAGLLMIVACPLSYVLGSVIIVRRWIVRDEVSGGWSFIRPEA